MSHFTVLVAAKDEKDLDEVMMPFHEYESTGIERFIEFVPEDMEKLWEKHKEYGKGRDFEDFIPEWSGAKKNDQGVWGRWSNPRSKWDWWVVGGRWSGLLMLKPGASGKNGRGGAFSPANTEEECADIARAGDVDWEAMRKHKTELAAVRFDKYHALPPKEDKDYEKRVYDAGFLFADASEIEDIKIFPKEQYIEKYGRADALTYAFIDTEGNWHGRGDMGWFGMSSDERPDYDLEWWNFVLSLEPGQMIFAVDCHI